MLTTQNPDPNQKPPFVLWRPVLTLWTWLVPPTQAHIDRQSRTSRYVFLTLMVVVAVAIMVAGLIFTRPAIQVYKRWVSDGHAAKAEKFEKQMMDYLEADRRLEYEEARNNAVLEANKAYVTDPDYPRAIRVLARLATHMGRTEARFLWDKLSKAGELTDEDFGWRMRALANNRENAEASNEIENALKEVKPSKRVAEVADEVMQRLGRTGPLLVLLKKYVADRPDDFDTKLLLGMREMQIGNDDDKKAGRAILWEIAAREDGVGLRALDFLDTQKDLSVEEQKQLIDRLENHPEAKEVHRIAALRRTAHLPGADKEGIIRKAITDRTNAKREDLVVLCRWLLDEGEFEKTADFLKSKEALVHDYQPLLDHYLTALTRLNRFDDLERLVDDPTVNLKAPDRAFHRVHLAYVLHKPEEELDKLLVEAVAVAINNRRLAMLLDLGHYAEQRKHYRTAVDAYKAASSSVTTEHAAYDGLLKVSYLAGNTKDFTDTARETARRWPDSQYYMERSLYANLLAGVELETTIVRSKKLFDARPTDSQRKILMGLANFRMADPQASRHVLEGVNLDEISPGQRAVLCGLIRATGLTHQAYDLAQTIPDSTIMLPEEANFLRRAKVR